MIKRKICSVEGCSYPVWAKKLCKYHQNLRTDKKPNQIKKTPIAKVSKKQLSALAIYRKRRDSFLKKHPNCMVSGCCNKSSDLHHKMGRIGKALIDTKWFMAVCRGCHNKIHNSSKWAEENSYIASDKEKSVYYGYYRRVEGS